MGWLKRDLTEKRPGILSNLRLRTKIVAAFVIVTLLSALNMAAVYFGHQEITAGEQSYRSSVAQSDTARDLDRELASYQSMARYFAVTGEEADGKKVEAAEPALRAVIANAISGATSASLRTRLDELSAEFDRFTKLFERIVTLKKDNALLSANQVVRGGTTLRYKFEALADSAALAGNKDLQGRVNDITTQLSNAAAAANLFAAKPNETVAGGAMARIKFLESAFAQITADGDGLNDKIMELTDQLGNYRQAFARMVENSQTIARLVGEMQGAANAMSQKSETIRTTLSADQTQIEKDSDATTAQTEKLVSVLTLGQIILSLLLALALSGGLSRPIVAMCAAMRELAGGKFDVVLPGLGRKD